MDVRVHLSHNRVQTLLDANPDVAMVVAEGGSFGFPVLAFPSIYFSNDPLLGVFSLSGPDLDDFAAFKASGTETSTVVSAGYFWRF